MIIKELINEVIASNYCLSEKLNELKKDIQGNNFDYYAKQLIELIEEKKSL